MSLPFYRRSRIKTKHTNHLGNFLAARCWGQEWLQIWVKQMAGQCYECRKNCLCSGSLSCMPTALFESKVKPCCKKQNCDLNCCLSVVTQGQQQSWQQIKQTPQSGWGKKVGEWNLTKFLLHSWINHRYFQVAYHIFIIDWYAQPHHLQCVNNVLSRQSKASKYVLTRSMKPVILHINVVQCWC